MHLAATGQNVARPPGCYGPAIAADDRVVSQTFAKFPCDNLWFHGFVLPCGALFHQLPPVFHSCLGSLKKLPVFFVLQKWHELTQSIAAIAHQTNLNRIAKSDAFRVKFDLDPFCLTWFRHELDVRE